MGDAFVRLSHRGAQRCLNELTCAISFRLERDWRNLVVDTPVGAAILRHWCTWRASHRSRQGEPVDDRTGWCLANVDYRLSQIKERLGLAAADGGRLTTAVQLEVVDGLVRQVCMCGNPDKLTGLDHEREITYRGTT